MGVNLAKHFKKNTQVILRVFFEIKQRGQAKGCQTPLHVSKTKPPMA